ncbi:MAG: peptigoglycan-binding protein LysM [Candidatus Beckwithbacteria bacterium GW2011_GWB1_47_15]|uniref:Peptigoglycan-binding protein LysM n=1 Tax=Candidatus Beckwithbacteria bacterium GW2011_GWB1_47_15 TaxID=1618371 RepID=A0A0G1U691_9BACT|nr:MAG: hypothetical protein UY43_C0001G1092 [Candidatus Beckwithbacteria bacterium GW2011_GWC1_49_16]AQS30671.1 hypothetical protein [uncultured bacterium]KKU35859.1 MAG: peptigoglycan-binding protein LysM [Candidatus Beckwithbacteria bacterium GW2011_GWA1_46_30]KKU61823.1 MAG: peptigoglycan-binding protein LysM [Candidatus Beckwithbacteria bacterium GW2011_GWB1_47_15]KKU72623.1 MAG: peptigoglycan-binding protein LysM [Candidatus Beckwithbacteria bacterium GW2011_GWA2_47_25]KKW04209.1 MAG: pe
MKRKEFSLVVSTLSLGKATTRLTVNLIKFMGWSLVWGVTMLPYQIFRVFLPKRGPGRPGSHPISKFFRSAFESKRARKFVGAGLAMVLMLSNLVGNILAVEGTQAVDPTLISTPETQVVTQTTLETPLEGVVAQGFNGLHRGVDVLAPIGTPIEPVADGVVKEASFGRLGWGNTIVVEHEGGLASRYAHLSQIKVVAGEKVSKDQVIGTVGMTGWTTGPHLHLEMYQNGRAINPLTVLPTFQSQLLALGQ